MLARATGVLLGPRMPNWCELLHLVACVFTYKCSGWCAQSMAQGDFLLGLGLNGSRSCSCMASVCAELIASALHARTMHVAMTRRAPRYCTSE
jgi:hypothetical protein